jgi:hypothetical protein
MARCEVKSIGLSRSIGTQADRCIGTQANRCQKRKPSYRLHVPTSLFLELQGVRRRQWRAHHKQHFLDDMGIQSTFFGRTGVQATFLCKSIAAAADGPNHCLNSQKLLYRSERFPGVAMAVCNAAGPRIEERNFN